MNDACLLAFATESSTENVRRCTFDHVPLRALFPPSDSFEILFVVLRETPRGFGNRKKLPVWAKQSNRIGYFRMYMRSPCRPAGRRSLSVAASRRRFKTYGGRVPLARHITADVGYEGKNERKRSSFCTIALVADASIAFCGNRDATDAIRPGERVEVGGSTSGFAQEKEHHAPVSPILRTNRIAPKAADAFTFGD